MLAAAIEDFGLMRGVSKGIWSPELSRLSPDEQQPSCWAASALTGEAEQQREETTSYVRHRIVLKVEIRRKTLVFEFRFKMIKTLFCMEHSGHKKTGLE